MPRAWQEWRMMWSLELKWNMSDEDSHDEDSIINDHSKWQKKIGSGCEPNPWVNNLYIGPYSSLLPSKNMFESLTNQTQAKSQGLLNS